MRCDGISSKVERHCPAGGTSLTDRLITPGRLFFALSIVAFGIQNLVYKGYVAGLELTPEWIPGHTFWAYSMGAALIAAGIGIAIEKNAQLAATLVGLLYFMSLALVRPFGMKLLNDVGERTGLFETLTICCGAWILAVAIPSQSAASKAWDGARGHIAELARVLFGVSMIVFGIDHFLVLRIIAGLIPSWIPGAWFWANLTGLAFIAAGASIISGKQMRLSAVLLGLMFFLWVVVLHAPRVAAHPHNGNEWNSAFVAFAICGESWVLLMVERSRQRPRTGRIY